MIKPLALILAVLSFVEAPAFALPAPFASAQRPTFAKPMQEPAPRDSWECVPFAREFSGIQIYGDALSWWGQAQGRYARGNRPSIGAVLSFMPHGNMHLGHVATVSAILDARRLLVTHANWSPINGRRGQIERNVEVIDVSEAGDWSRVRVWFAPLGSIGGTQWPTNGFIYPRAAQPGPNHPGSIQPGPKLIFASFQPLPIQRLAAQPIRPTGRLSYLRPLLTKLGRTQ